MSTAISIGGALTLGLVGSAHCVAMCGPMAALTGASPRRLLPYHAGRLLSYALAGTVAAGLGAALIPAHGRADLVRLALAAVLFLIGIGLLLPRRQVNPFERLGARAWRVLAPLARHLNPRGGARDALLLGGLWGFLPCGMVYSTLALAALAGAPAGGALTMLAFGVGTLPALLGLGLGSRVLSARQTLTPRRLGTALVVSALWLAAMPLGTVTGADPHAGHAHHAHHQPVADDSKNPASLR